MIVTVIYGSKYSRYRHTLQTSWTCLCAYPVIEYHCSNVPSRMASHSSLFCGSCYLRLVPGTNHQYSYNKHKLHHVFFYQDFTMHELKDHSFFHVMIKPHIMYFFGRPITSLRLGNWPGWWAYERRQSCITSQNQFPGLPQSVVSIKRKSS